MLIYFDRPTQRRIIERFLPLLRPEVLLFVGHSEGLFHCADLFRALGRTVYAPLAGRAAGGERLVHRLQTLVLDLRFFVARLRLLADPAEAAVLLAELADRVS